MKYKKSINIVGIVLIGILLIYLFFLIATKNNSTYCVTYTQENKEEQARIKQELQKQLGMVIASEAEIEKIQLEKIFSNDGYIISVVYKNQGKTHTEEKAIDEKNIAFEDYMKVNKIRSYENKIHYCIITLSCMAILVSIFRIIVELKQKNQRKEWKLLLWVTLLSVAIVILLYQSKQTILKGNVEISSYQTKEDTTTNNIPTQKNEYEIRYTYKQADQSRIEVRAVDAAMGRYAIEIYRMQSKDQNWELVNTEGNALWVHYDTKFKFIDLELGFYLDPGRQGAEYSPELCVTQDGGKTWKKIVLEKPDSIPEKNLLIKDLPEEKDGKLSLITYTLKYENGFGVKTYYEYISEDRGNTWRFKGRIEE